MNAAEPDPTEIALGVVGIPLGIFGWRMSVLFYSRKSLGSYARFRGCG